MSRKTAQPKKRMDISQLAAALVNMVTAEKLKAKPAKEAKL